MLYVALASAYLLAVVLWRVSMDLSQLKIDSGAVLSNYNAMKQSLADANAKVANLTDQLATATANAADPAIVAAIDADLKAMTGA